MASVTLRRVEKRFGPVRAVRDLDLEIRDREFLTLVGPSGCGKTTTLRMIAGLEHPTSGEIYFDGQPVTHLDANRRDIAMVFQSYALYPHMTAAENMAFPLRMMRVPRAEIERRVREVAAMLGLDGLLGRHPRELSGGQRQRVALGRAIVRQAAVFLLDEPLSNLDAKLRVGMRAEIKRLHHELAQTMIYVTHDQAEALTMSDRIAVLHEGVLQQLGTPDEVYNRPRNLFVAGFLGSPPMNLLPGHLMRDDGGLWFGGEKDARLPVPDRWHARLDKARAAVTLGVRPEAVVLSRNGDVAVPASSDRPPALRGTVYVIEPMGSDLFVTVQVGGWLVKARSAPEFTVRVGETLLVSLHPHKLHFFDSETGETLAA